MEPVKKHLMGMGGRRADETKPSGGEPSAVPQEHTFEGVVGSVSADGGLVVLRLLGATYKFTESGHPIRRDPAPSVTLALDLSPEETRTLHLGQRFAITIRTIPDDPSS